MVMVFHTWKSVAYYMGEFTKNKNINSITYLFLALRLLFFRYINNNYDTLLNIGDLL